MKTQICAPKVAASRAGWRNMSQICTTLLTSPWNRALSGAALLFLLAAGCASHRATTAHIPGCKIAEAYVGPGCYTQKVLGGVEVRCPGGTMKYHCDRVDNNSR
jgi:hypothetical protein